RDDVQFVLVGDGRLEGEIRQYIDTHALQHNVTLTGWAPHHELPRYFAAAKLQVLPSYNEGLPHVMLEAMACGTPVLATPVGAVAQVIKDKETGFLLYDNSPDGIARSIMDVLTYPELRRIAVNARTLVERDFRYKNVLKRWHDVICNNGR
ncbi:MAG: glycosyltransferase, partial [Halobacteriota archaeon]